jgi:hypothetical protein
MGELEIILIKNKFGQGLEGISGEGAFSRIALDFIALHRKETLTGPRTEVFSKVTVSGPYRSRQRR